MIAEALQIPVAPDFIGQIQGRLLRGFAAAVNDWGESIPALTLWEDENMLEHPTSEMLALHKAALEKLIRIGAFFSLATEQPEFPDRQVAEIVAATQQTLRDKLAMWHGPRMTEVEADRVLAACFPE